MRWTQIKITSGQNVGTIEGLAFPIGGFNRELRTSLDDVITKTHNWVSKDKNESEKSLDFKNNNLGWNGYELVLNNETQKLSPLPLLFLLSQMYSHRDGDLGKALDLISSYLDLDIKNSSTSNMHLLMIEAVRCAHEYNLTLESEIVSKPLLYFRSRINSYEFQNIIADQLKDLVRNQMNKLENGLALVKKKETPIVQQSQPIDSNQCRHIMTQQERKIWFDSKIKGPD